MLLSGCGLMPSRPPAPFAVLPPATYGGAVRAEQVLTITRPGGASTLQAYVEIAPEKISVVGATALGQRVLTVSYDDAGLHAGPSAKGPDPESVLRDLQLVTWPLPALQQAVAGTHWRIEEPREGTRQLWRDDVPVAEIHYAGRSPWDGRSWLVNLEQRYTLDIESKALH